MLWQMQVHVVVAPVFATNCCLVASGDGGPGSHVVVVDAGAGVAEQVAKVVDARGWQVQAILATHGHADHTWDAAALSKRYGVPVRIHAADAYRLADPFGTLSAPGPDGGSGLDGALVASAIKQGVTALKTADDYEQPSNVVTFTEAGDDGQGNLHAGEVLLKLLHAPGHTEGSTLFLTDDVVLSGDVLFAGSIGRTDLAGADPAAMERSLRRLKTELPPGDRVIPGHGPGTTVAHELATNPFLRQ